MKQLFTVLVVFVIALFTLAMNVQAQTTLISPTGDGGFENGATFPANGWTPVNYATTTNSNWFLTSSSIANGTYSFAPTAGRAAFVSNNDGVAWRYTTLPVVSTTHLYRDVTFPTGETTALLSFRWNAGGETTWDIMYVYLCPTTLTPVTGSPSGSGSGVTWTGTGSATLLGSFNLLAAGSGQTNIVNIPASVMGNASSPSTMRLVFTWKNDGGGGIEPPAAIDDISLKTYPTVPFSGAYTINKDVATGGTNYSSLTEAFLFLNAMGVSGPTTFTVTGSTSTVTYPEGNLTLGGAYVSGVPQSALLTTLNSTNTLTFVNGAGKTINMSGVGLSTTIDFVFRLQGVDYVTFDGINILDVGGTITTQFEFGYIIVNASVSDGANNNTIKNFAATLFKANTGQANGPYGVMVQNGTTLVSALGSAGTYASRNNNNKIQNFTINGAKRGVSFSGLALPSYDEGNEVSGPAFTSASGGTWVGGSRITNGGGATAGTDWGVGIDGQKNFKLFNVQIDNFVETSSSPALSGIHFGTAAGTAVGADNAEIYNCVIRDLQNNLSTANGVIGIRSSGSALVKTKIYNTAIYDLRATAATGANVIVGMQLTSTGAGSKFELYNNSIHLTGNLGTGGTAKGMGFGTTTNVYIAKNNIVSVTGGGTGGTIANAIDFGAAATLIDFSNNLYDVGTTTTTKRVAFYTAARQNLIDWQSALATPSDGVDQRSGYGVPGFTSATNLLISGANRVNNSGVAITGLSTSNDILGVARGANPDLGVFEGDFSASFVDAAVPGIFITPLDGSIAAEIPVTIRDNVETGSNLAIRLWYRLGISGAFTALVPDVTPSGATNGTYRWSTSLRGLAAGTYQYYIVARDAALNSFAVPTVVPGSTVAFTTTGDPNFTTNPITGVGVRTFQNAGTVLVGDIYSVGPTGTFASLTAVAAAVNTRPISGHVIFELQSTYTGAGEVYPITFNQPSYTVSGPLTITIRPAAGVSTPLVTAGNPGGSNTLIVLDGARDIIFDGRPGGEGTSRMWTIRNNKDSAATNNAGAAFFLLNDALRNTLRYLKIEANTTTGFGGVVNIGSTYYGGQGNNFNTIDNCDIGPFAGTVAVPPNPVRGIATGGGANALNQNNTYSNNLIHDFHNLASNPIGISLSGEVGATITGNSIYQTASRSGWAAFGLGIVVGGATGPGPVITNNYIGGTAPLCGGTPMTITATTTVFYAMQLTLGMFTTPTVINGNTMTNWNFTTSNTTAGSLVALGINFAATNGTNQMPVSVRNNVIGSTSVDATTSPAITLTSASTGAPSTFGGYFASAGGVISFASNSIGGVRLLTTGAGTTSFLGFQQQTNGIVAKIDSNTIGSATTANNIVQNTNAAVSGIVQTSTIVGNPSISYNTVANILYDATVAGLSQNFTGISASGTASPMIVGNVIRNVVGNNQPATGVLGIFMNASGLGAVIRGNTISNFTINPQTASTSVTIFGLRINASASTGIVEKNLIHSLVNGSTSTSAILTGIYNSFGARWTYINNMISLGTGSNGDIIVRGADDYSDGAGGGFWYYNSILISGSVPAGTINTAAFYRQTASTPMDVRNNIFVNLRVGPASPHRHFAVVNTASATGWPATASDRNVFNTTSTTIGQWLGASTTLAQWQAAQPAGSGGDANSVVGDPQFTGLTDLHVNTGAAVASVAANVGTPVSGYTTDIDETTRNASTPDAGYDEFTLPAPAAFSLTSPSNGAVSQPLSISLNWTASAQVSSYEVLVNVFPATPATVVETVTGTSYIFVASPATQYNWSVRAKNGDASTLAGNGPFNFTTIQPPNPPSNLLLTTSLEGSPKAAEKLAQANELRRRLESVSSKYEAVELQKQLDKLTESLESVTARVDISFQDNAPDGGDTEDRFYLYARLGEQPVVGNPAHRIATLSPSPGSGATITYAHTGLGLNERWYYRVTAENAQGESTPASNDITTLVRTPGAPAFSDVRRNQMKVYVDPVTNPATATYAIFEESTGKYVSAAGTLTSSSAVWRTYSAWGGGSGQLVTGLERGTTYTFKVNASNSADVPTGFGPSASQQTTFDQPVIALDQNFSGATFPPTNWLLFDEPTVRWSRLTAVQPNGVSGGAAKYDFYNAPGGEIDTLVSPVMDLSGAFSATLNWYHAYRTYGGELDSVKVLISSNGGTTWAVLQSDGNPGMATLGASTSAFTPTAASNWRLNSVTIPSQFRTSTARVAWYAKSAYGNNYWLDDITLVGEALPNTITVRKKSDADGDIYTTGDQAAKVWQLQLRAGSVSGTLVASGNTSDLVVPNLLDGTYFAVEADSTGWNHAGYMLNGVNTVSSSNNVAVAVTGGGQSREVVFFNDPPTTITIRKFEDLDRDWGTINDREPLPWLMQLRQGSPSGTIVAQANAETLVVPNLPNGTYYAVITDSTEWDHLGYVLDGTPVLSGTNAVEFVVSGGAARSIDFVNKWSGRVAIVSSTGSNTNNGSRRFPYQTIQYAVNQVSFGRSLETNPGTIFVAAGTYREQIYINTNVTLIGAGASSTFIVPPIASISAIISGTTQRPIIGVDVGGTNVIIEGFTIDGEGRANGSTHLRMTGIQYFKSSGIVRNNIVTRIRRTPFDADQTLAGILVNHDGTTFSHSVEIHNNTVQDWEKAGIVANHPGTTANIHDNIVIGQGTSATVSQNGIQVGLGATGTVANNTISAINYSSSPASSTGILAFASGGTVVISGNNIANAQTGIFLNQSGSYPSGSSNATVSGNTVTASAAGVGTSTYYGSVVSSIGSPSLRPAEQVSQISIQANPFGFDEMADVAQKVGGPGAIEATMSVSYSNNSFTNSGSPSGTGLLMFAYDLSPLTATASGNTISGWATGILTGKDVDASLTATINQNSILSNTTGLSNITDVLQDAKQNWWGHATGPLDTKTLPDVPNYNNLYALGNPVSTFVDYSPFYFDAGKTTLASVPVTISVAPATIAEGDVGQTNLTFAVTLSSISGHTITVNYATANGTATIADGDYDAASGTLTFTPGTSSQNATVVVNGDLKYEQDETLTLNLTSPNQYATISTGSATGTITNDDPIPQASINDVSVTEGDAGTTPAIFAVTLTNPSYEAITLNYSTLNGSATVADGDYDAASGSVTFLSGSTSENLTILVNGDLRNESNETFFVNLAHPVLKATKTGTPAEMDGIETSAVTISDDQGQGTILNDDSEPSLSIDDISVTEGDGGTVNAVFTVTLSAVSGQTVTVAYATANGSATTADNDYASASGTLTFAPGVTTQQVTVVVNGDTKFETDETYTVGLSNAANATIADGSGLGTITNDDSQPAITIDDVSVTETNSGTVNAVFTVTLSNKSYETVTVDYATANGSATLADNDYAANSGTVTFAPDALTQTVTVAVNGDTKFEIDENYFVDLSTPSNGSISDSQGEGTILNDDSQPTITIANVSESEGNSGTTPFVFSLTLSNASYQTVMVDYATANGTATIADNDYAAANGTVTFAPDATSQTITVNVNGDTKNEADETFAVNLSNAVNATLGMVKNNQAGGTIVNDDPVVDITINDVSVTEGNSGTINATFTVSLSAVPGQTVTVAYTTANGTATVADGDYNSTSGTLNFAPGVTTQTVTVQVVGDLRNEIDETFFVNLSSAVNGNITDDQGLGTILNDDPLPSVTIANLSLNEGNVGNTSFNFVVTLSAVSGQTVTVQYTTGDGTALTSDGDYTGVSSPQTLTFNPGETELLALVLVGGDTKYELDETFNVNLAGAVNATIAVNQATGTIQNDDPVPTLSVGTYSANEGNSGPTIFNIPVTLSNPSYQTISAAYYSADGTALVSDGDYDFVSGSALNFAPGTTSQTIPVTVHGDTKYEPNETFLMNILNPTNATIALAQNTVTILNDDAPPEISISDVSLIEGNPPGTTAFTFNVTLSNAINQAVTVVYNTANGTATLADYTAASGTVTFAPGSTSQPIIVQVTRDLRNEVDETFFVNLTSPTNATIADAQGLGTILNDDAPPTISINDPAGVNEGHSGTTPITFAVSLSGNETEQTITVNYTTGDGTATVADNDYVPVTGAPNTITFNPGVTTQNVAILVNGDIWLEPDETFFVNLSAPVIGTIADGQGIGTILNDDYALSTITINKKRDADANFATDADRYAKNWRLELREGSPSGTLVASVASGTTLTVPNLLIGTYYAVEADSAGWSHIGYVLDGTPTASSNNYAQIDITAANQTRTIDMVNTWIKSTVYVDPAGSNVSGDGSPQFPYATIQKGIDDVTVTGTVNVAAGTYQEQVLINKNLTLSGAGASTTTIIPPVAVMSQPFAPARLERPIIGVNVLGTNVTIEGFTVDGQGAANTHDRMVGIHYFKGSGTIRNNIITRIRRTPFDGTQTNAGILVNHDYPNNYSHSVEIHNNTVNDFGKGGIVCNHPGAVANVHHNIIVGQGPVGSPNAAQNGVQIGYGATGTVANNTVSNISYTAGSWGASGILGFASGGTLSISNNTVTNTQVAVNLQQDHWGSWPAGTSNAVVSNNILSASAAGTGVTNLSGAVTWSVGGPSLKNGEGRELTKFAASPFVDQDVEKPGIAPLTGGLEATMTVSFTGNTFTNSSPAPTSGSSGIYLIAANTSPQTATLTGNTITGYEVGVVTDKDPGATLTSTLRQNNMSSNTTGMYDLTSVLQDARENWWGYATGPLDTKTLPGTPNYNNPSGQGNGVTSYVDYSPFYLDAAMTNLSIYTLTMAQVGNGTVTVTPPTGPYNHGTVVTLEADPTECSSFTGWTGDVVSANLSVPLYMDGNKSVTATFTENAAPTVTCPSDITVNNDPGVCTASVSFSASTTGEPAPTVEYKIGLTTITSPHIFPAGVTTVTVTATNACGTATCSFTVTVNDNTAPVISGCPSNIGPIAMDAGLCGAVATWVAPTASDNCAVTSFTSTHNPGDLFPAGVTTVIYTATDAAGNSSTCSFTVTVEADAQAPVISGCSSNIGPVAMDAGQCGAVVSWTAPTVNDNCPGATIAQTSGPASGSLFPAGVSTVVYTATDAQGNTSTCSFTVTVSPDAQAPVISGCPSGPTVYTGSGRATCDQVATWTEPTANDNCGGAMNYTTRSHAPGSTFPVGATVVTYTFTDAALNTSTCSFTVTVVDNTVPVIANCPSDIGPVAMDAGQCGAVVSWTAPTAGDNCPGVTIMQTSGLASGSLFPAGVSTVVYTATDAAGNTSICSFTVTVNDGQAPVISGCPSNIGPIAMDAGLCGAVATWVPPTANDNCAVTNFTSTHNPGDLFPAGVTTVIYTATDAAGNSSTCSFTVTVEADAQVPVISGCPSDIGPVAMDAGQCGAVVSWTAPTVNDNCPGAIIAQTSGPANGSLFPAGVSTVVYTATDAQGNSATCSFTVTVEPDAQAPVITGCPSGPTVYTGSGRATCDQVATWTEPTANDNCDGAMTYTTRSHAPGSTFPVGSTLVTYTFTDAANNTSTCSFTVTVIDNTVPVISGCPSNISQPTDAGNCTAVVSWTAPTAIDNCAVTNFTSTHNPGDLFPAGVTTVVYTATDAAGNTSTCSFTVTVNDQQAPSITCVSTPQVRNANITYTAVGTEFDPVSTSDNCSVQGVTNSYNGLSTLAGAVFPAGNTLVTWTVTDGSANQSSCAITVTVVINTFTITPTAGANGSISPSAPVVLNYGSNQTFTMTPAEGYMVADVLVDGISVGPVTSHTFTYVTANHSIIATFGIQAYPLNITLAGNGSGSVTKTPDQPTYQYGQVVTLEALPAVSSNFVGWSGDASGTTNPLPVTMNAPKNITATFTLKIYTITASAGSNGSISPSGSVSVNHGANQAFAFTANPGYQVGDVLVNGSSIGAPLSYTFTNVTANGHTIAVTFVPNMYTLDIAIIGSGEVLRNLPGPTYPYGSSVILTANAFTGYAFAGWSGDASGSLNPLTVLIDGNKSITATFDAQTCAAWTSRYNNTPINKIDGMGFVIPTDARLMTRNLAVDLSGNTYVAGYSDAGLTAGRLDFMVIKYSSSGSIAWAKRFNSPSNRDDKAYALAIDNAGNVYVTGESYTGTASAVDILTIKYNPAGDTVWTKRYSGAGARKDAGYAIAVHPSGSFVYVTGESDRGTASTRIDYVTVCYDAAGVQQWAMTYDGGANKTDKAYAIALDGSGNVIVTGESNGGLTPDYATVKYNSAGVQQWAKRYNFAAKRDYAFAVKADAAGNVYVTGASEGATSKFDYATLKYDAAGNELWVGGKRYNHTRNQNDYAYDLALDASGNVYVTGASQGDFFYYSANHDYATLKYDGSGNQLWLNRYEGGIGRSDIARSIVASNADGAVFVTGSSDQGAGRRLDYLTLRLPMAGSGTIFPDWAGRYNGVTFDDIAYNVAMRPGGSCLVLTGTSNGGTTNIDFATIQGSALSPMPAAITSPAVFYDGKDDEDGVPKQYAVYDNYPNPFNPSTTIRVDVASPSFVTLKVYNLLGQEVAKLWDREWMEVGTQEVVFEALGLASGVYFYHVVAETVGDDVSSTQGFSMTKKMLLVK